MPQTEDTYDKKPTTGSTYLKALVEYPIGAWLENIMMAWKVLVKEVHRGKTL